MRSWLAFLIVKIFVTTFDLAVLLDDDLAYGVLDGMAKERTIAKVQSRYNNSVMARQAHTDSKCRKR